MQAPVHCGQGAVGKVASVATRTYQAVLACLILLLSLPAGSATATGQEPTMVTVGQAFPDFTLAAANAEAGQRLLEQRGAPVMLLVLDKCDRCEKSLAFYTKLANTYQAQDLVAWMIWTPYKKHQPPRMDMPVLNLHSNPNAPFSGERPQIYLINRDGTLAQHLSGSLRSLSKTTEPILQTWMQAQARPVKP